MKESYTSNPIGIRARLRELAVLWSYHRSGASTRVRALVASAEEVSNRLRDEYGFDVAGQRVLDVGPGQFLIQATYFALRSEVVGIDQEFIAQDLTPRKFFEMISYNGPQRAIKTLARKVLGIDRGYAHALRQVFGVAHLPGIRLYRGDAGRMPFPDQSFDMIYSRAVLHSILNPGAVLSEMARVLKPGGVVHVNLHLYSSVNGSLDSRIMFGGSSDFWWAHLRGVEDVVQGALLNKLRLSEWRTTFAEKWPGSVVETIQSSDKTVHQAAEKLLAKHDITCYSYEELVTTTVVAMWQKPSRTT